MKKALCIILTLLLLFSAAGCASVSELLSGEKQEATETEKQTEKRHRDETEKKETEAPVMPAETDPPTTEAPETDPPMITVRFDPNGGEVVSGETELEIPAGTAPAYPEVKRTGYKLERWTETAGEDGTRLFTAVWTETSLSARELYEKASQSVVEIHVFDADGTYFAQGSGFFVNDYGTLATNYHVIEGAYSATAILNDAEYDIPYVLAYDEDMDLALLDCDIEESIPLELSERDVHVGDTVYTLGSSLGLTGTFSDGIVSTVSREVDGKDCIQVTAPISHGNSGGPLLNEYCEVIGVNSMTYTEGQNLNFAIKIRLVMDMLETAGPASRVEMSAMSGYTPGSSDWEPSGEADYPEDAEGAEVFLDADYSEMEPNDYWFVADSLEDSCWTAGYSGVDDIDYFTFTLTETTTIGLNLYSYYAEDLEYMLCGIFDESLDELITDLNGTVGVLSEFDDYNLYEEFTLPAGTYYIVVGLDDVEYPYTFGAFYEICFWMD